MSSGAKAIVAAILVAAVIIGGAILVIGKEPGIEPGAYYDVTADWCADHGGTYAVIGEVQMCAVSSE